MMMAVFTSGLLAYVLPAAYMPPAPVFMQEADAGVAAATTSSVGLLALWGHSACTRRVVVGWVVDDVSSVPDNQCM